MTRNTFNRRRVLAGAGAGITGVVAGCLGGSGGGDDEVHFITDYYNDSWEPLWGDLESEFEDETDTSLNIEEGGMSGTQEGRLAQLIQAGEPPDANTSTFDQVADIWETGQLETVNDVVSSIEEVNGEINTEAFLGEGDDIYQIPHGLYVSNFQYRADIYEQLGLDEPETFQDVLDNAQVIDESDEVDARGYGLAGMPTGKSQDEFLVLLSSAGVSGIGLRWSDPDAREELEVYFPEEEVTMVLQYMKDLAEYSPDPTSIGWAESLSQWVQGQYAQCYHLNAWPVGVTALTAEAQDNDALRGLAEATQVRAYPTWGEIDKDDNWLSAPAPDGYHVFSNGTNTAGAKEWFEWLYADSMERTVSFYEADPGRFLPTYSDVLGSDAFQNQDIFQAHPHLLEKLEYCQNEIWGNHYGSVDEANISSPESLYMQRQWFYGEMVNRVVTESMTIQEAYEWGRGELEDAFAAAQEQFG
ncbi:ABC transporter substrate-binding protein [Natrinema longum]|uniref:Carbohydrate ABC transporter substrate-binding protein n=1 Tax=Natrinema longum TaxID=370324 RepID=A0A8A2UD89_9EURY|nr:ABC transporter substrate-binding protein [Natrinema longum]MBZ6495240.1 ABC transporter substrate-binding protein [Natrinema longum]QSW86781.1 carbohydrate ABC transporter substrate-binding protein [Natrinema longum]